LSYVVLSRFRDDLTEIRHGCVRQRLDRFKPCFQCKEALSSLARIRYYLKRCSAAGSTKYSAPQVAARQIVELRVVGQTYKCCELPEQLYNELSTNYDMRGPGSAIGQGPPERVVGARRARLRGSKIEVRGTTGALRAGPGRPHGPFVRVFLSIFPWSVLTGREQMLGPLSPTCSSDIRVCCAAAPCYRQLNCGVRQLIARCNSEDRPVQSDPQAHAPPPRQPGSLVESVVFSCLCSLV